LERVRAEFQHPALSRLFNELAAFASEPQVQSHDSASRMAGRVVVIALPECPSAVYLRHVVAAVTTGNSVLLAPLSSMQELIAGRLVRALPDVVRRAGSSPGSTAAAGGLFVTLTATTARFEKEPDAAHDRPHDQRRDLCALYQENGESKV
jgi:hypothetical protein